MAGPGIKLTPWNILFGGLGLIYKYLQISIYLVNHLKLNFVVMARNDFSDLGNKMSQSCLYSITSFSWETLFFKEFLSVQEYVSFQVLFFKLWGNSLTTKFLVNSWRETGEICISQEKKKDINLPSSPSLNLKDVFDKKKKDTNLPSFPSIWNLTRWKKINLPSFPSFNLNFS